MTTTRPRRDKGEGGIYPETVPDPTPEQPDRRKPTGRWFGQLDLGKDAAGNRRRRKFTGAKRADVAKAMREARRELESGYALGKATDTVESLLRDFLAKGLPTSAKSARTVDGYRWAIEDHLIPTVGGRKLRELSVDDVDDMLRAKARGDADTGVRPLSRASLLHLHGVLRRALRWGQQRGRVARNVAELVDTPNGTRRVGKSLTVEQAKRVIELASAERMVNGKPWREPLEALYILGIARPCRPGELTGLPWSSVDFENGVIHFRQALHHAVDGGLYLGALKTEQSRRSVDVDPFVMEALKRRRAAQLADKLRLPAGETWGSGWSMESLNGLDSDLVFTTVTGGPIDSSNLRRSFGRLLKRAGVEGAWTVYELRHSAVSILSEQGLSIEDIADYAGHKNSNVTRAVYRHQIAPTVTRAKGIMQGLFGSDSQTG